MALGALDAIRHEIGLAVPADVAVVGFDDIVEAGHAAYALSTVRTPVPEMIDHMMRLVGGGPAEGEPASIQIPAELVLRSSTRAPVRTEAAE